MYPLSSTDADPLAIKVLISSCLKRLGLARKKNPPLLRDYQVKPLFNLVSPSSVYTFDF